MGLIMPSSFDKQDVRILKLLQTNGALTTGEIADKTNMSQSPCWRRIHRIENEGLIHKRVALLNRDQLGMEVVVFATINLSVQGRSQLETFEHEVKSHPEVVECYTMTGTWDYMLKIITKNIRHYESFVRDKLATMPLVSEMHSHIAVTEIKNTTELPLDSQL